MERGSTADSLQAFLAQEANRDLIRGALILAIVGLVGGVAPTLLALLGAAENLWLPAGTAFFAGLYSLAIFLLARAGMIRGWLRRAVLLGLVLLPTGFFLASHVLLPAGAATYLTGPFSYLYFVIIIGIGFMSDMHLSFWSGITAAGGFLLCTWLAQPALTTVSSVDSTLTQDLTSFPIYTIKAVMMFFGGLLMAALTEINRKRTLRFKEEQDRKEHISRLFGQYVSPEVCERIVSEKNELLGERRQVAVLFADLRGFTTFSEKADPAQVVLQLNEYFDAMVESITRAGGTVDKFIGDAIMAVFGGVVPLQRPCSAALAAARGMRTGLKALNEQWRARGMRTFENGIGVHFGEVMQGNLGSRARKEFTVVGDTVNLASRLEGLTKEHAVPILISEQVLAQLSEEEKRACSDLGRVTVKGRREEIRICGLADPPEDRGSMGALPGGAP